MAYIKVWCEYDIGGQFGGNNNETIFFVDSSLDKEDIDELLEEAFSELWEEVSDPDDASFLSTGLLGWEFIKVEELK